jgi:hypothetical protein
LVFSRAILSQRGAMNDKDEASGAGAVCAAQAEERSRRESWWSHARRIHKAV